MRNNDVTYFDSFGAEHISKEIRTFINRPLCSASQTQIFRTQLFRIQAYDSIMCGYFCIGFINFILAGKTLTEFTNLFSPNNFKKNYDIILNYFMSNIYFLKSYCLKCRKDTENINPEVSSTSNGRAMILSKLAICGSKNSIFIKNQEAKGLLSNLGIRTPLSKVPILGDILL